MVDSLNTTNASSDTPSAYAVHTNGWVPTIEHSGRAAPYLRSERFRRKVKPTAASAIAYATKVISWRAHFADYKRRRVEALANPNYFRFLEAAE